MLNKFASVSLLLAALCGVARASGEQWIEVRSSHFTVLTDSNEKQARHIADQFERMRWMFQRLFPAVDVDPVSPIVVLAAKNQKSFEALEPEAYLAAGQLKLGGYFMRTAVTNYVVLNLDADDEHPYAKIYHEYTHLQFSDDSRWMPLWLNEGIAEFVQNTEIRDKDVIIGNPNADDIRYLQQNRLIPLPVLFKVDAKSPYYHEEQKGSVFYAESWALTHYLFIADRQGHTNKLGAYWALLSRHVDPVTAAEQAFGNLDALQAALEEYIQRRIYMHLILSSAAAPIDDASFKMRTVGQGEADATRADLLMYVQRVKEAQALLDALLKADPDNVQARETMGFLELHDGHREAAQRWFSAVESSLRAAIKLNPRVVETYDQLASILIFEGQISAAETVLRDSMKAARTPSDMARTQRRIAELVARQPAMVSTTASAAKEQSDDEARVKQAIEEEKPKHPPGPPSGPTHELIGVIRKVQCSYTAVIDFQLAGVKKTISLYSNNYYKLDFSALGYTPEGKLNPCSGIEGMKARVQYAESPDKTVDGQAVAVELRK